MPSDLRHGFRVGSWKVEPLRGAITGPDGESKHLEPKVMDVLVCLAEHAFELVTRDDLLRAVWGERAVSDEPLTRTIAALRRALNDDRGQPKYIETVPKRGYRLIAEIRRQESADDAAPVLEATYPWANRRTLFLAGAVVLVLLAVLVGLNVEALRERLRSWDESSSVASIAVLPFRNRSDTAGDAHFVDGFYDDILTQLSKISSLDRVISRTSMERYRDTEKPVPQIGEELGVATILEGGVQRSRDRVRINVQLIDARADKHLWAETYDRQLTVENLFAIQSEISREIAARLQVVLTDQENERLQTPPTTSLEAYREYVLGRHEASKRTAESVHRAQTHFEKAIEHDPEYALAYVGLADSLTLQVIFADRFGAETYEPRRAAIDKALELDPRSGEAHTSLAVLKWANNEVAEEDFLKAIELSPSYATAYLLYSAYLRSAARDEEALPHIRKAIELDPFEPALIQNLSDTLHFLGRIEEAQVVLLEGIERNPEYPSYYLRMGAQLNWLGRIGEATRWYRAGVSLGTPTRQLLLVECDQYLQLGDDRASERCVHSVADTFPNKAHPVAMVNLHLFRSEYGQACNLMQANPAFSKDQLARVCLLSGDLEKARSIWQDLAPDLYGDEAAIIEPKELGPAILAAYTLYADGELDRANYLFDQALETMQSMHRTRGRGYGIWDVFIHATRGDRQKTIAALRDAIDTGWRYDWWFYPRFPPFDSMQEDPEWIALMNELEADIARQRQWYEEHKDEPLF